VTVTAYRKKELMACPQRTHADRSGSSVKAPARAFWWVQPCRALRWVPTNPGIGFLPTDTTDMMAPNVNGRAAASSRSATRDGYVICGLFLLFTCDASELEAWEGGTKCHA
jgi:hypothetical protein